MKKFRIYKASKHTYRVLHVETGVIVVDKCHSITAADPTFVVDQSGYLKAKEKGFVNSGDPLDYFAYIETNSVILGATFQAPTRIKFNPFKAGHFFRDSDLSEIKVAKVVTVIGNDLFVIE